MRARHTHTPKEEKVRSSVEKMQDTQPWMECEALGLEMGMASISGLMSLWLVHFAPSEMGMVLAMTSHFRLDEPLVGALVVH